MINNEVIEAILYIADCIRFSNKIKDKVSCRFCAKRDDCQYYQPERRNERWDCPLFEWK